VSWTSGSRRARLRSRGPPCSRRTRRRSRGFPAFIVWTASPVIGISTTTVVCARVAISTSLCPAPTVSTNTMSMPSASRPAHGVERREGEASSVAAGRHRSDEDPGSTPVSAIRIRSPSTAPPVYGDVGSTATTPTFRSRLRYLRTSRLIRELFPTPAAPWNPTTVGSCPCAGRSARGRPSPPASIVLDQGDELRGPRVYRRPASRRRGSRPSRARLPSGPARPHAPLARRLETRRSLPGASGTEERP